MTIKCTVIAHSKSAESGKEIVTFELEYPRFIHSELMTHRLFSRNASSSRAIPVKKMIEMVRENPAMPIHWGKNQPGMQAKEECTNEVGPGGCTAKEAWHFASLSASEFAEDFDAAGYHKQIVNRLLEPFQWMKTVVTATELDNFFWLRKHPDAQPEIKRLAEVVYEALKASKPYVLPCGYWHTPYFENGFWGPGLPVSLKDALAISSSCCAQVSYRKLDASLEKATDIFERLVGSEPVHASPFEHQATPMECTVKHDCSTDGDVNVPTNPKTWEKGITHVDRDGGLWSGNFKRWIQHRQLIPNNACWEYDV